MKSTKQKTIKEKFENLFKHDVIFTIMIISLYILAIFSPMWHNNNEGAHSNMQSHIYRDMYNNTIDFDHEIEARGWHKECVENETIVSTILIKTEIKEDYTLTYRYDVSEYDFDEGYLPNNTNILIEKKNTTYCTKYQLVTTQ